MKNAPSASLKATEAAPSDAAQKHTFTRQWIALIIALLIIGGVIANILYGERKELLTSAEERLTLGAKSVAFTTERRLISIHTALEDLRKNLPYLSAQQDRAAQIAMQLMSLSHAVEGVRTLTVFDVQGTVVASSRNELLGQNFSQREYFQFFQQNPNSGVLHVSRPFKTILGTFSLTLTLPTFNEQGDFSGVILAALNPEDFKPILAALRYTTDVSAGLIHGSGEVLLYVSTPDVPPGTDVSDPASFFSRHLKSGKEHSLATGSTPVLHGERLAAMQTINTASLSMSAPLVVVLSQEIAGILAPWHEDVRHQTVLFVLLLGFTIVALYVAQSRQRRLGRLEQRHQAARRHDIDRLKLATEASGTGIWELDLKTRNLSWDDTMFRLYGVIRPDFSSTYDAWRKCVLPEDLPATEAELERSIEAATDFDTLFRIRRGDGEIRIIDARAWVYKDETGQPTRLIGVNRDITERQQTKQSLRDSQDFTASILHSLIQHIAVLDEHGTILTVNQAWEDFARDNCSPGHALKSVGLSYLEICTSAPAYDFGAEALAVRDGIKGVLEGTQAEFSLEYPCHSPDEERWFIMHVTPLRGIRRGAVVSHENITQRKRIERAVQESEERFSAFFENAMVGMATTSLEKGWLLANPALCAILGYPKEELLKKTWAELTHPEDLAADLAHFKRLTSGETDRYSMEKRFIRKDGAIVDAFIAVSVVRRTDKRLAFFAAVVEDISERKQAEAALIGAQKVTQQFLDQLPGTAYVKDENLRVMMANKAFQTMLGLDPATMIGKSNAELFPGNFGKKLDDDDRQVLASSNTSIIEEDFEGRFFETNKFVIESENGKRLLGGITMEVTQRHKFIARQEALIRIAKLGGTLPEEEFLRQGLEIIEHLTLSHIGFIHFVNEDQETIELVTWTAGALKGCTAVHESHYPIQSAGIWADCARNKEISVFNDYPAYKAKMGLPEGHAHLQRLISVPVIEEGKVRVILGVGNKGADYDDFDCATAQVIGNDMWRIVRRVRAESALKQKLDELLALNAKLDETNNRLLQSEKLAALGQLAAGVAHEINNPIGYVSSNLHSLHGYIDDLLAITAAYADVEMQLSPSMPQAFKRARQAMTDADYDFIVSDIQLLLSQSDEGLTRVRRIVQDLKDFSRVGATGWQWVNLHEGLESTLNIVWNEIKYKAVVERDYGDLPDVHCIPSQINQIFLNLLTNAAQAIEGHGQIFLCSRREGESVWIEVQDTGAGIAPENLDKLFEPFFTTKPVGQGTGLGLSLSWGIVQRHHGKIEVRSTLGQGTTFRVTLPIDPHPNSESSEISNETDS